MVALRHLEILRAVAAEGSLARAARRLHYSQPTVTYHLTNLERHFGTRLVDRGPRGASLTEAGAVLLPHAEAVVARMAAARSEVLAVVASGRGQ
ncbi:molybdate transport repressor ModE-like protein [Streptacidiphilus sp. MAP12-20]|uniref:helix-turn-helix domain-containing protein n=1 Tax=Streptacidiphilus sp. MAP12-20 TaxID=3156299 RepID=UPI003515676B